MFSYWLHPYGFIAIWLQLLEFTRNAAEYALAWIRRAKDAAQYGETLRDVNVLIYLQFKSVIIFMAKIGSQM